MGRKIELLAPAGSMANLKAAVSKGADAVYLGMKRFSARDFATNFNKEFLKEAVKICKSNNVRAYLAMNTLVKNNELKDFFNQLSFAYSRGIDAVILQEISFLDLIKKNYPDLKIHISTQSGVMNSDSANILPGADRITLARELAKDEIKNIRNNFQKELEIFCHGALCASISGQCLFSSFLGGRSGNRGKCAQPCRKKYNNEYYLSTKELCLISRIPEIINMDIDAVKIEGRMRTPYYVATVTDIYRKAIDSHYDGNFNVSKDMINKLRDAFSRDFTEGWFSRSKDIFNRKKATGESNISNIREMYEVKTKEINSERKKIDVKLPEIKHEKSRQKKLLVRVYNKKDAIDASSNGADIIYFDILDNSFNEIKNEINCNLFGVTPRIMLDKDIELIKNNIKEKNPDGILAGNLGMINLNLSIPIHLEYNLNCFNGIDLDYFSKMNILPVISPELSIEELSGFRNKNFAVLVHGKIRLMALRHELKEDLIKDERGGIFKLNKIINGTEILNRKELGLLGRSSQLLDYGISNFFVDTDQNVGNIVKLYRKILDGQRINDSKIKRNYVLGWSYREIL